MSGSGQFDNIGTYHSIGGTPQQGFNSNKGERVACLLTARYVERRTIAIVGA
jgi:hypothetical protein